MVESCKNFVKRTFYIIILFLSVFTNAQDKKAKILLDEVTAKVKSHNNIVLDFKYTISNSKENLNQESKGSVTMKGNQYVLNLMGVTKLFDGKNIYTINSEDEEISIAKFTKKDDKSFTPSKMLTFFNVGFRYSLDVIHNVKGRKIQNIKLTPLNPKDLMKDVMMGVDTETKNIYNIIQNAKNGTKTSIFINSYKTNQPLSKNQFIFVESKYPKYYINKLD